MAIISSYLTQNPCYKKNINYKSISSPQERARYETFQKNGPKGLMLHSVGCPQPSAKAFINMWNKSSYGDACVHAFIDANTGDIYQCLPWNYRAWHAGADANNTHIGVEMCEPDCIRYTSGSSFTCSNLSRAKEMVTRTYNSAVTLFAMLCKQYNLNPQKDGVIISHAEGARRGIASNHGDPEHLWRQLNLPFTMNSFRADVAKAMGTVNPASVTPTPTPNPTPTPTPTTAKTPFLAKITADVLNVRKGAGTNYAITTTVKRGDIYTITEVVNGWGKLKSGAGWISLNYTEAIKSTITETKPKEFKVKVTADVLNIRKGASTNYAIVGTIKDHGVFTIVEENNGWGKLKSGAGWIYLEYTKRV